MRGAEQAPLFCLYLEHGMKIQVVAGAEPKPLRIDDVRPGQAFRRSWGTMIYLCLTQHIFLANDGEICNKDDFTGTAVELLPKQRFIIDSD